MNNTLLKFNSLFHPVYLTDGRDPQGIDTRIIAHTGKYPIIAEEYRIMQTALHALIGGKDIKVIALTSSQKDEGKTITTCNLAVTLATDSKNKVLLIDCDLRKPDIHNLFNIKRSPGLSDIINGACRINDILNSPTIGNLFILPVGSITQNPSELLRRQETRNLIADLKKSFDYVIIDTPPVMPVSDSRILGVLCDAIILVARAEKTSRKSIKETLWLLETAKIKPIATVLTDYQPPFYSSTEYSKYYGSS